MRRIIEKFRTSFCITHENPVSSLEAELAPLRIPLKDILTATKDFAEENLLKRGGKVDVYKGFLLRSKGGMDVVIHKYSSHPFEFYEDIKRISCFKHENVVSLIGFCDEKDERMIVMEHVVNGSLHKYLSDPATLTWSRRLKICCDAERALRWLFRKTSYLHINKGGFKILLDANWKAKVVIYMESLESLYDTENSDHMLHSFGKMLLEMLIGRRAVIEDVNLFVVQMEKDQLHEEGEELDDMIDPALRKQMFPESLSIFLDTTYRCLTEHTGQRIYTSTIEGRLHEALAIQWEEEHHLLLKKVAYLKIPLSHIKLATDNFSDTYRIKSDTYESVYKAELDCFDTKSTLIKEWENKGEHPKKAIIIYRIDRCRKSIKDLYEEIEILSGCNHPNLLTFLGFCDEYYKMILVFECDFKETLDDYLKRASKTNISWEQRLCVCLDIVHGLQYLQYLECRRSMINQATHNVNVFLDENGAAKIANFCACKFDRCPPYFEPPFVSSDQRLVADDMYSLGVILFQILTGRLDYDLFYMWKNVSGRIFSEEILKNMIDPMIKQVAQDSLDTFSKITYQCLAEMRPKLELVIKSLEKALHLQYTMLQAQKLEHLKIPLEYIKSITKNFDIKFRIGSGGYGEVYKAELKIKGKDEVLEPNTVAIKRIIYRKDGQGNEGFLAELDVLSKCKHPNLVSLLGFCVEDGEMILVYELASNGSLDDYLGSIDKMFNLSWAQRLKMCIDIAQGLKYIHTTMGEKENIIHRDIKSANILLGKNWEAKIADFGLSKVHHGNQGVSTINTKTLAGTEFYLDPEYVRTGRLKKASDIYSFGVVLFEIFTGKLTYDSDYIMKNEKGLAPIARRHFKKGTLKEILDPKLMDEAYELGFIGKVEPDHDSLNAFSRIAYQCVAKTQVERPTIKVVIEELEKALHFQENRIKSLNISLEHIKLGVEDFNVDNCIMKGGYGMLYKGKVQYNNRHKKVAVKRFSPDKYFNHTKFSWEHGFMKEFEVLFKYKHENIIGLVGFCKEMDEKIIVYEHASVGGLDRYLNDTSFSWTKRLKICIDIANGLKFLHGDDLGKDVVIHRDLKSSNVLLNKHCKAKICCFELALTYPPNQEIEYVIDNVEGSLGYCDPLFHETHFLTKESDIYSFGVILFEILCGRSACPEDFRDHSQFLDVLVKHHFEDEPLIDIVFDDIKEQIGPKSLATFRKIAFQCLHSKREQRPTACDVLVQLEKALKVQEAFEIHEAKFHKNDKIVPSKSREIYSTMAKKDIYSILSKGILLQDDKLEIIRVLQETTWDHEQSDDDYH